MGRGGAGRPLRRRWGGRTAGTAAERPGDQMRRCPAEDAGDAGCGERLRGERRRGFVGVERGAGDAGIEIRDQDVKAHDRAGGLHRLELRLEPVGARHRLLHVLAALLHQSIAAGFEAPDAFGRRQPLARGLRVELDHAPPDLVEGASEALAVLLGELRPLRADERCDEGDREGQSARQHEGVPFGIGTKDRNGDAALRRRRGTGQKPRPSHALDRQRDALADADAQGNEARSARRDGNGAAAEARGS